MKSNFWHVCYVKPRSEKIVQRKLQEAGIKVFLPIVRQRRIYKNSKKTLHLPLFPGYIFVNIEPGNRHNITVLSEVLRFIRFRDEYAKVSEEEILNLMLLVNNKDFTEVDSSLEYHKGEKVEVIDGPFKGIKGSLLNIQRKGEVVIEIFAIKRFITFKTDIKYLKSIQVEEKELAFSN